MSATALALSKTKAVGNLVEDVDVVKGAAEGVLAGTPGVDGDVGQRVDALGLAGRESAVDDEALRGVLRIDVVVAVLELDGSLAGTVLADLVVLTVVRGSTNTTGDGVAGLPVDGESVASAVLETLGLLSVLRLARIVVDTDGAALVTVVLLLGEVLGVGRTPDTRIVSMLTCRSRYETYSKP